MLNPRTRLEDFEELQRVKSRLAIQANQGKYKSQKQFDEVLFRLERRFIGRVCEADEYLFDNMQSLNDFLIMNNLSPLPTNVVEHELEHARVAMSLGHSVKFGFYALYIDPTKIGISPFVKYSEADIKDIFKITTAPTRLSDADQRYVGH